MRSLFLGLVLFAAACGPGAPFETKKTYIHDFTVDNGHDVPLTVTFYGYYGGLCEKGRIAQRIAAHTRQSVEVKFERCVNDGGKRVASILARTEGGTRFHLTNPGDLIVCDGDGCRNAPIDQGAERP